MSERELIAASYDAAAASFAGTADRLVYRRVAEPLVTAVRMRAGTRCGPVLDVAAGTGAVGSHFASAVAVDISRRQLAHNRSGRRLCAAAEHLPFPSSSFAAAVCGFGINHAREPSSMIREMARVARVVGVSTWAVPADPYRPLDVVMRVLGEGRAGRRSPVGALVDRYGAAVATPEAVSSLLAGAGLEASTSVETVTIPWPGADRYLDYRLSMPTTAIQPSRRLREMLRRELDRLPAADLVWRPRIIVGVGGRVG